MPPLFSPDLRPVQSFLRLGGETPRRCFFWSGNNLLGADGGGGGAGETIKKTRSAYFRVFLSQVTDASPTLSFDFAIKRAIFQGNAMYDLG
jgi:hypothetical protein